MTEAVPRAVVEAFYKVYAARDAEKVAEFLDDNVEWTISGPVDVLPFCGKRHGKAAVLDLISQGVPAVFDAAEQVLGHPLAIHDASSAGHSVAI